MVKGGVIYTPPPHASILVGITRDSVINIAQDLGYIVEERDMDRGMIYTSDEVFFTGTAAEVTPIREVDGHLIGEPGPITKRIQEKFFDVVKGKVKKYEDWLDYV
jgi:branched-chain amino acid aminotransferase